MLRWVNVCLFLIAAIGVYPAWNAAQTRSRLVGEYQRLAEKVGGFPVTDPSRVHVKALDTGDPLQFAWQMYVPANTRVQWRLSMSGSHGNSTFRRSHSYREIVQLRFREIDGDWCVWQDSMGGSSYRSGLGREFAKVFAEPERLKIEQLGAKRVVEKDTGEIITLLRITPPIADNAETTGAAFILLQVGPPEAWEKLDQGDRQ